MTSAPPPPQTPPPLHYPGNGTRVGHRLRPVVIAAIIAVVILIAAAITAAIVLMGTAKQPELPPMLPNSHAAMGAPAQSGTPRRATVALTAADSIAIGQGISITPAPGWTLADHDTDSVLLRNADSSAQMYVTLKPAGGTDVVAVLQADINNLLKTSSGGLVDAGLGKPDTKTLQSTKFQQAASIDYIADVSTQQGTISVMGAFSELLNTSNQLSAFIDYRQTGDAPDQASIDNGNMIRSML